MTEDAIDGAFNHIASEMNKGRSFEQAATSYAEQFPQSIVTAALLGGGIHAAADLRKNGQGGPDASNTPPEQSPQHYRPGPDSPQPPAPADNNAQQPTTSPADPTGYVDPAKPHTGQPTHTTVDAEGREVVPPPPGSPQPPPGPGVPITPIEIESHSATGEPSSRNTIPQSTTESAADSGSGQQSSTPVNNGQPSSIPPPPGSQPPRATDASSSSPQHIPLNTTQSAAAVPPGMQPSPQAAAAGQVMTMENGPQVLEDIARLKAKEKNGGLSKDEQIDLHHAENILARTQVANLEAEQKALRNLPQPRELDPHKTQALAKAKAMLERPWPGTSPKPEPQTSALASAAATTSTSSSGSLPPGPSATTSGDTAPAGIVTDTHTGTRELDDGPTVTTSTESSTSTSSSGGTTTQSTDSSTHTTPTGGVAPQQGSPGGGSNGTTGSTHTTDTSAPPQIGYGKLIPETTTNAEHIDLARRRAVNLEKIAAKRKLDPHEQSVYDNAHRILDRNASAQPSDRDSPPPTPGSRNTGNPDDLAMSGDADALVPVTPDGEDAHLDAAADTPPVAVPTQSTNAVGSEVQSPNASTNTNTTVASANANSAQPSGPNPSNPQRSSTPATPSTNSVDARPSSRDSLKPPGIQTRQPSGTNTPPSVGASPPPTNRENDTPASSKPTGQSSSAPNKGVPLSHDELKSLAKEKCTSLAKETLAKHGKKAPGATSVAIDPLTGKTYGATSLKNITASQPSIIDPRLKEIHDQIVKNSGTVKGHENWYITNCAEFNAVNNALLAGAKPENWSAPEL